MNDMPGQLEKLKKNMDSILKNGEKINDAVDKVNLLDNIIKEVDSKINAIENSKEGINATEERLQKLYKDSEKQIDLLHSIVSKDSGKKKSPAGKSITPQLRSNVIALRKTKGWTNSEIAQSLGIEENVVELILQFGTDE